MSISNSKEELQSIVFLRDKGWDKTTSDKVIRNLRKDFQLKTKSSDTKYHPNQIRYRVNDPKKYKSFKKIKTGIDGIIFIIGK